MLLYHGTHVESATALEVGTPLDEVVASERHIDGELGFYLATAIGDAEFFAWRRWIGRVVVYELSDTAVQDLTNAGATSGPIPGGRPPYFEGAEFFVPAAAFELFNELVERGEIVVRS